MRSNSKNKWAKAKRTDSQAKVHWTKTAELLTEKWIQGVARNTLLLLEWNWKLQWEMELTSSHPQVGITLFSWPLVAEDYFHHQQILPLNKSWLSCTKTGQKGPMWVQVPCNPCPRCSPASQSRTNCTKSYLQQWLQLAESWKEGPQQRMTEAEMLPSWRGLVWISSGESR